MRILLTATSSLRLCVHIKFYNNPGAGTDINLIPFQIVFHNPFSCKCAAALCWPADKVHLFTFPLFHAAVIVAIAMAKNKCEQCKYETNSPACSMLNLIYSRPTAFEPLLMQRALRISP